MALRNGAAGVYEIVHLPTGRRYVGSSIDMRARWREHRVSLLRCTHHSIALQRAWSKYGDNEFCFRPLLICSRETTVFFEQRAIDTLRPEFNCSPTAGSQLGYRHRAETIQKMKAAAVGRPSSFKGFRHSAESRRLISENKRGKSSGPLTDRRRQRISDALKGRAVPVDRRALISASLTGLKQSKETIARRVEKLRGKKRSPEVRLAASERMRGKRMPDSAIAKMRRSKSVLSNDQVISVRRRLIAGDRQFAIAKDMGVDQSVISEIHCGKTYTWVTCDGR